MSAIFIGCAGWSISRACADAFPGEGSHLERYARNLPAVEINSSFYRPHRPITYARWAATAPRNFRFAVKMPREITHNRRLTGHAEPLARFLAEAGELGDRLGPLLVQLPPSLAFDSARAANFFNDLRRSFNGTVVCEPRHPSWFSKDAETMLISFQVARVLADPPPVPAAHRRGGWPNFSYFRLHGSPQIYHSPYGEERVAEWVQELMAAAQSGPAWCIFDNTAEGAALTDALTAWKMVIASPV